MPLGDEISFNGTEGLSSSQLIRAIRDKAFSENKADDPKYMLMLASLCFDGPAMEWFEHLDLNIQTDWYLFRRAILVRFPPSGTSQGRIISLLRN